MITVWTVSVNEKIMKFCLSLYLTACFWLHTLLVSFILHFFFFLTGSAFLIHYMYIHIIILYMYYMYMYIHIIILYMY